jgi:3-polyprenyl-4-hydroxybenzoate decarboxylase
VGYTCRFGHILKHETEGSESFIERVAETAMKNKVRVILVHQDIPERSEYMKKLLNSWHRLTP